MKKFLKKAYHFSGTWPGTIIIVLLVIFFVAQAFIIPSGSMKSSLLVGDYLFVKKYSYGIPTPHIPWLEFPLLPDFNKNGHLIEGKKPQRGDIVVFRYPLDVKTHYVKRCVALGDDEVIFAEKTLFVRFNEGDEFMRSNYPDKLITLSGKIFVKDPFKDKFNGIQYDNRVNLFNEMARYSSTNELAMKPILVDELEKSSLPFNAFYFKVPKDEFFMMGDNRDHSNDSRFWGSVAYSLIVGKPWFIYFSWDDEYKVRWDRIGRFVDTLETDKNFIHQEF